MLCTRAGLKAVSLARPRLSFLSVNQCLPTTRATTAPPPPPTCTGSRPGASQRGKERKRKSIVSLSLNCQCGQQPVNHRSRAMADLPEHRSGKIFIKLITARLVIALFQRRAGERSERLEFICGLLVSCHICCRCCKRSLFS